MRFFLILSIIHRFSTPCRFSSLLYFWFIDSSIRHVPRCPWRVSRSRWDSLSPRLFRRVIFPEIFSLWFILSPTPFRASRYRRITLSFLSLSLSSSHFHCSSLSLTLFSASYTCAFSPRSSASRCLLSPHCKNNTINLILYLWFWSELEIKTREFDVSSGFWFKFEYEIILSMVCC